MQYEVYTRGYSVIVYADDIQKALSKLIETDPTIKIEEVMAIESQEFADAEEEYRKLEVCELIT